MKHRPRRGPPAPPLPPDTPERWRARQVRKLRARLERDAFPRVEMMLLVAVTGAVGLLASWALRLSGLAHMGVRYLFALALAYAAFLALLRIWMRLRPSEHVDLPNLDAPGGGHGPGGFDGGGGGFGGGGASGSYDSPLVVDTGDAAGGLLDGLGGALDAEGCAIPLLLLAVLVAVVLAALTVVWSAPALFAELMLDGLLAAGLYRRLKQAALSHWLDTALRRTAWPFVATCVLVAGTGFVLQALVPQADTLGTAIEALRSAPAPR
jgi:hypothetical protein